MYDFEETTILSLDEIVLAFRSTLSGLSKLSKIDPPSEAEIESIIVQAFDSTSADNIENENQGMEREEFVLFCLNTPEIVSWIDYFDDLEEFEQVIHTYSPESVKIVGNLTRTTQQNKVMNCTVGGYEKFQRESEFGPKDIVRKPWENVVPLLSTTKISEKPMESPIHNITMEWIYIIIVLRHYFVD